MLRKCAALTGFLIITLWTNSASALCLLDCGGGGAAPEINASGGVTALALLISVVAVVYHRVAARLDAS